MSLAQFLFKQLIDVIEWNEPADGILAWRFPIEDMEIQNGASLTVQDSQMAAFVHEGRIADIFGPGRYTLTTSNLPILTDLLNWDKGFLSPFQSEVYFFSTHLQLDQKWGTATPITLRDEEFGAVRIRSYGIYAYRLADPRLFFKQISGTRASYPASELEDHLRDTIVASLGPIIAGSKLSFLDLTANESALDATLLAGLKPAFAALGLELTQFAVDNISLPDELQKTLDQRISMKMAGNLDDYTRFAAAQAMKLAAANPSGAAALGMGLGLGAALAQSIPTPNAASATFCSACGHALPAHAAAFCPGCGQKQ